MSSLSSLLTYQYKEEYQMDGSEDKSPIKYFPNLREKKVSNFKGHQYVNMYISITDNTIKLIYVK